MTRWILLAAAVIGAAAAAPLMADQLTYQGTTSGSFTDSATANVLSFAGTGFGPATTVGGSATLSDLGTFTVTLASSGSVNATGNFNLTVSFTIPSGANVNPITAAVSGTINTQNANNVLINFGVGQTVNFSNVDGSGSFFLTVNDVSFPQQSQTGATQKLTGSITNAVFTPTNPNSTVVPEPASISLLSTFTLAAGFALYRRRRRNIQ